MRLWNVLVQASAVYIMHFLGSLYEDVTSFEKCRHIALSQTSDKWCAVSTT